MGMNVELYNNDGSDWDAFVASIPHGANYHRYRWRDVIEKSFGHRAYYLVARDGNGEICGVLPLAHMKSVMFGSFLVSLPYFNYGGLLCMDANAERALLAKAQSLLRKVSAGHMELRHVHDCSNDLMTRQHKVTMILPLGKSEEAQWKALDAKVRNQVRKAERSGLNAVEGRLELLDGFYEVFCRNMRDLGTPVYGRNFFRNILEMFPESTCIISVMLGEKTVASGILAWYGDTLEVPWASSIRDYREMCPNNLLYWRAICYAIGNGSAKFDFGRSTPGEGTYHFKKQWGAEPVQLYWQYMLGNGGSIPELNPGNPKYRLAVRVWQRLPLALTNALGPRIVKNIP
ncbi:MAG TPA: FemAB family XrtA/PEP-CTERM system-associated protein [Geobacteraceae bacterium]|nr:FemAB family XrtA/PEP-CTERM system-associated protein [Geobacteraceae bacterium]